MYNIDRRDGGGGSKNSFLWQTPQIRFDVKTFFCIQDTTIQFPKSIFHKKAFILNI